MLALQIKVRLPNDQIVIGRLEINKRDIDFAVVNVENVRRFHGAAYLRLDHEMQFEPYRKVVAVSLCFNSGLFMVETGVDLASPSGRIYETMLSTCQINKVRCLVTVQMNDCMMISTALICISLCTLMHILSFRHH